MRHETPKTDTLTHRLDALSRDNFYNVYESIDWPEKLDPDRTAMAPELTTLSGTDYWSSLTDEQIRKLTITETATLFSNTLNGERILVAGLASQIYSAKVSPEVTEYLHHFLDEENKHMIMFGVFCNRYIGRVYPEKKVQFEPVHSAEEELLRFYALAMVVEAYGDFYNVRAMKDDACEPVVRRISELHHLDEARHLSFDRSFLTELAAESLPAMAPEQVSKFQAWLAGFMRTNWLTFYNPAAYKDAGIPDPYEVAQSAFRAPAQVALREKITEPVTRFFLKIGLLAQTPELI